MEKVFITMHDLTIDARVVYASDSISDVLGYAPHEVVGKSCFDYFHPDEVPSARKIHSRGIQLDKAAMLIYCKVRQKDGGYVYCECIFSVVYDVFVAAISIHSRSSKSEGRALTAPVIRRVFSSSPSDPRYHMLTHLSSKFRTPPPGFHEPRAALILNRFTRSLTILYASHALGDILEFPPNEAIGKSFYECISQHCLQDAVEALERAKENDSIAYLRFQWRDPRQLNQNRVRRRVQPHRKTRSKRKRDNQDDEVSDNCQRDTKRIADMKSASQERANEGASTSLGATSSSNISQHIATRTAVESLADEGQDAEDAWNAEDHMTSDEFLGIIDVEAVVSCTSDGLVVILRRARPLIPKPLHGTQKGVYASPWAPVPLGAPPSAQEAIGDAAQMALLDTIKQVAVFAWSLRQLGGEAVSNPNRPISNGQAESSTKQSLLTESSSDSVSTASRSTMGTPPSRTTSQSNASHRDSLSNNTEVASVIDSSQTDNVIASAATAEASKIALKDILEVSFSPT